jgi:hypothetical protein
LDLLEQISRHINGAGFALLFAGEVMGRMTFSFLAMAARATATPLDKDQAGGQDGGFGMQVLEAGLQMASDERGMFGGSDEAIGALDSARHIGYVILLIRCVNQNRESEEIFFWAIGELEWPKVKSPIIRRSESGIRGAKKNYSSELGQIIHP